MATTKPSDFAPIDGGFRLDDAGYIRNGLLYMNSAVSTYGIVAAGTNQATATQLNSTLNQIDTTTANTGVNLPLSTGKHSTPCQFCVVANNGASTLNVYGFQGSTDMINGVAGSTAQTIPAQASAIFVSVKGGAWYTADVGGIGSFTGIVNAGNFTETLVGSGFVQKFSATGTGRAGTFTLNGATTVTVTNTTVAFTDFIGMSVNTPAGNVGAVPHVAAIAPGATFTVVGTAGDTSIYNYSMFGVN